jgi:hypothetical protein
LKTPKSRARNNKMAAKKEIQTIIFNYELRIMNYELWITKILPWSWYKSLLHKKKCLHFWKHFLIEIELRFTKLILQFW